MKEKINNIPLPVVIIAAIALLGLAGWAISSRIQSDNGSYTANMDRNRYMAEMKKQMGAGRGGGSQYSASGSMESRGAGGRPGGRGAACASCGAHGPGSGHPHVSPKA